MSDWPACRVCGDPVELDELARLRRTRAETLLREEIPGYRSPEDVHAGDCLRRYDSQLAREAIARSTVQDAPRPGTTG